MHTVTSRACLPMFKTQHLFAYTDSCQLMAHAYRTTCHFCESLQKEIAWRTARWLAIDAMFHKDVPFRDWKCLNLHLSPIYSLTVEIWPRIGLHYWRIINFTNEMPNIHFHQIPDTQPKETHSVWTIWYVGRRNRFRPSAPTPYTKLNEGVPRVTWLPLKYLYLAVSLEWAKPAERLNFKHFK